MNTLILITLLLAALLFGIKIIYVLCTAMVLRSTRGALYVSTTHTRIAAALNAVHMQRGDLWIDLGCGDGRVLRQAEQRYQVKAIGYELNLMAYVSAKIMSLGRAGIQIRLQNFFKVDLGQANIVSCYLFPDVMPDLAKKIRSELRPGTFVVSFNFPLPSFTPKEVLRPQGSLHSDPIFIYQV